MERKRKISPQRQESINNAIALIKEVMATRKKFTKQEFTKLSRKHHVRDGILKYAVERGYCKKIGLRKCYYEFVAGWKPTPRYVSFILDDRADYLYECYQKRKQKKVATKKVDLSTKSPEKSTKSESKSEKKILIRKKSSENKKRLLPNFSIYELEEINIAINNKLKELDKICLNYLDTIDTLEEKIESLENQKEQAYQLLFKMQKLEIERKENKLKQAG